MMKSSQPILAFRLEAVNSHRPSEDQSRTLSSVGIGSSVRAEPSSVISKVLCTQSRRSLSCRPGLMMSCLSSADQELGNRRSAQPSTTRPASAPLSSPCTHNASPFSYATRRPSREIRARDEQSSTTTRYSPFSGSMAIEHAASGLGLTCDINFTLPLSTEDAERWFVLPWRPRDPRRRVRSLSGPARRMRTGGNDHPAKTQGS